MIKQNSNLKIEDLLPGDILLFPPNDWPKGWVGQLILLLTKGKVSHSAVYRGLRDGEKEPEVAHSCPDGIVFMSLEALLKSEPGCYVMRRHLTSGKSIDEVLKVVDGYTNHGNNYPFINLVILGLLILENRFLEDTLFNRAFYVFTEYLALKIMEAVADKVHPGKTPMTCSQFAAQCYTNAKGGDFDIKFNHLLLQFGKCKTTDKNENLFSLQDILESAGNYNEKNDFGKTLEFASKEEEEKIVSNFIQLIKEEHGNADKMISKDNEAAKEQLFKAGKKLSDVLKELGYTLPKNKEFLSSTERNFFVTPDDLLSNTNNLTTVGYIDKTVYHAVEC